MSVETVHLFSDISGGSDFFFFFWILPLRKIIVLRLCYFLSLGVSGNCK